MIGLRPNLNQTICKIYETNQLFSELINVWYDAPSAVTKWHPGSLSLPRTLANTATTYPYPNTLPNAGSLPIYRME